MAQEQISANTAASWPHIEERSRKRIHEDLVQEAGWSTPAEVVDPRKSARDLAAIGIKVVMEPPPTEVD